MFIFAFGYEIGERGIRNIAFCYGNQLILRVFFDKYYFCDFLLQLSNLSARCKQNSPSTPRVDEPSGNQWTAICFFAIFYECRCFKDLLACWRWQRTITYFEQRAFVLRPQYPSLINRHTHFVWAGKNVQMKMHKTTRKGTVMKCVMEASSAI